MDTSEEYIRMCEKAEEIQALFKWEYHDFHWDTNENKLCIDEISTRSVWLPRQDQLQEILIGKDNHRCWFLYSDLAHTLKDVHNFAMNTAWGLGSMEQLWLAFVMREKFNKTWNGKKWVP